jgi:hypothetical protein
MSRKANSLRPLTTREIQGIRYGRSRFDNVRRVADDGDTDATGIESAGQCDAEQHEDNDAA